MGTRRGCKQNVGGDGGLYQKSAKEVLGVSQVESERMRGACWWCAEVKEKVRAKQ